jgi:hypothetical protein
MAIRFKCSKINYKLNVNKYKKLSRETAFHSHQDLSRTIYNRKFLCTKESYNIYLLNFKKNINHKLQVIN